MKSGVKASVGGTVTEMASASGNHVTAIIFFLILPVAATGEFVSVCLNNSQTPLQINCGSGNMLYITKTFYGHSSSNSCFFQPGDCTQIEHKTYPCTGWDSCIINIPSGSSGHKRIVCDRYSTYVQVEYFCEPVVQTVDICRSNVLTDQKGFISTPRYPNNFRDQLDCLTRITVHPRQVVTLTVIDMDLEINGTYGCNDWLYAFNQKNSVTLCGRRSNEKLITLQSNDISIRFQSDGKVNRKGFWVYYEAYPPYLSTTTKPKTNVMKTLLAQKPLETSTTLRFQPGLVVQALETKSPETTPKLPFVAIVSGVIGTLTVILIVLLILLVYRWWNDKQYTEYRRKPQHVECIEARNPAFRSSTGAELQGIEICYIQR